MNTLELMDQIWQQIEPTIYVCRNEFLASLEGWEITAREIDGVTIGATLTRGPEFHFITFGHRRSFPASLIEDCLGPIIEKHGFVLTSTPKDDVRQRRFNQLIGFYVMGENEHFTYFRLDKLSLHGGSKKCQS